jgi:hypothetical protein
MARMPMRMRYLVLVGATLAAYRPVVAQNPADTALAQIERRATGGDRAAARALADSLLAALPPGSDQYAEALYWRAFTASSAAEAERDYLRVGVEYPLSRRAPAALLTLAQLEYARGDHGAAQRHFERLLLDHPNGTHVAKAAYWSGRLALDGGDDNRGCASLSVARRSVATDDVELLNQIEYHLARCTTPADSAVVAVVDSAAPAPAAREFSIQAGAFETRRDATALAERLKTRGFDARVAGTRAPFRVRIGRYATREEAATALGRVRRTSPRAFIVEAEPR